MYTKLLLYIVASSFVPIHSQFELYDEPQDIGQIRNHDTSVKNLPNARTSYQQDIKSSRIQFQDTSAKVPFISNRATTSANIPEQFNPPSNPADPNNHGSQLLPQQQPQRVPALQLSSVPDRNQVPNYHQPTNVQHAGGRPDTRIPPTAVYRPFNENVASYSISDQQTVIFPTPQAGIQNGHISGGTLTERLGSTSDVQLPAHPQQSGPKASPLALSAMKRGIEMMQIIGRERHGNSVISPLSIVTALSILQQGARGSSEQELTEFLQSDKSTSVQRIKKFRNNLKYAAGGNILKMPNAIFLNKAFNLDNQFKNTISGIKTDVHSLNFNQPYLAASDINRWVSESTGNLIPTLVDSRNLEPSTQLLLASAVFFKGIWNTTFPNERTRPRAFTVQPGVEKPVLFMNQNGQFRAGDDAALKAKWLFLPFLNDEFTMLFLLPNEKSGLNTMMDSLTPAALERILRDDTSREVIVGIPKFKLSFETNLVNTLAQLNIQAIFNPEADLSGLGTPSTHERLYVSKVIHKATIEIDEQGGTASAVTSLAVNTLSLGSYNDEFRFIANHPFLVLLFDKASSGPLFMARIEDPLSV